MLPTPGLRLAASWLTPLLLLAAGPLPAGAEEAGLRLLIEDSVGRRAAPRRTRLYDGAASAPGTLDLLAGDLKRAAALAEAVRARRTPLTAWLWEAALSPDTRQLLEGWDGASDLPWDLQDGLAADLSGVIVGPLVFTEARFAGVPLTAELTSSLERLASLEPEARQQRANRDLTARTNRRLLEAAFPGHLPACDPVATVTGEAWAEVSPGAWWLVSADDPRLRVRVEVEAGAKREEVVQVAGLWIRFNSNPERRQDVWHLFRPRPAEELRRTLGWLRYRSAGWDAHALRRRGVQEEDLEEARRALRSALPGLLRSPAPEVRREFKYATGYAMRVLATAGQPADAELVVRSCRLEPRDSHLMTWWAEAIGTLEARHGTLERGTLVKQLEHADPDWRVAAALALHQLGVLEGDPVLHAHLAEAALAEVNPAAWTLLDSNDPATLVAMRRLLDRALDGALNSLRQSVLTPVCMYLIVHGTPEDIARVTSVPHVWGLAVPLSFFDQDPLALADLLIDAGLGEEALRLSVGFRDRPPGHALVLFQQLRHAVASSESERSPERLRPYVYDDTLNWCDTSTSYHTPNRTAAIFYGPFGRTDPLEPGFDERGNPSLLSRLWWFAEPRFVDRYVAWWREGRYGFQHQLDYCSTDDVVKAVGDDPPPGYAMFLAAHRVSTMDRVNMRDILPLGLERRAYVLRHRGKTQGGISGVAELSTEWSDGGAVRVHLRLRQAAHYQRGFLDTTPTEEFEHHRYVVDHGRGLIESVTLERDGKEVVAREVEGPDGGELVFEADLGARDPAGWDLFVTLRFFDERIVLPFNLFAGESARRHRLDAARAAAARGPRETR